MVCSEDHGSAACIYVGRKHYRVSNPLFNFGVTIAIVFLITAIVIVLFHYFFQLSTPYSIHTEDGKSNGVPKHVCYTYKSRSFL